MLHHHTHDHHTHDHHTHDHHTHEHHHHHHHGFDPGIANRFITAIILNLLFVGSEFFLAWRYDSAGLLADAGHNLGDVVGLIISLAAFFMLKKDSSKRFTYGFKRATIVAAFFNALILMAAVLLIIIECVEKFSSGAAASGIGIMLTASAGIVVNGMTVFLLSSNRKGDLNIKSAYLHMLADTLVSAGVAISGAVIYLTGWHWVDPSLGLLIAGLIIWNSRELFTESCCLLLDSVPHKIDLAALTEELQQVVNVEKIYHIHLWSVSTTEPAFTAHIKICDLAQLESTRSSLKAILNHYGINHSTLEFETGSVTTTNSYGCPPSPAGERV